MKTLIKSGNIFTKNGFIRSDVLIDSGKILQVAPNIECADATIIDATDLIVSPGFIDLHVHLREPGFEQKETVESGTMAAARGGFTTICAMPNLNPVTDSAESYKNLAAIIARDAKINVLPFCAITKSERGAELVDFDALGGECKIFSDDGRGVQNADMMREAMKKAARQGALICAHCEDESLLTPGGCMHDGNRARELGQAGICSASEFAQVGRDCELALQENCRYHVCHVSTEQSLEFVRRAKAAGGRVSCEITPHHAVLCEDDITADDGKFKMNPPLRSRSDRDAILRALQDGTADCIATDHAPHTSDEKSRGLANSAMGIVGLETAFSILHTNLVLCGKLSLEKLLHLMTYGPASVLWPESENYGLICGNKADIVLLNCEKKGTIDNKDFASKGKSTPFDGYSIIGRVVRTICGGKTVFEEGVTI